MNNSRLIVFFLLFVLIVPSTMQANISISVDMLKASWFQAVELIKNNNGAKIITLFALGTTGLSIGLGYKLWRSNKEKEALIKEHTRKIHETPVQVVNINEKNNDLEKNKASEAVEGKFESENRKLKEEIRNFLTDKFPLICDLIARDVDREVGPDIKSMAGEFSVLSIFSDNQIRLTNMINIARGNALIVYPLIATVQKKCDSIPVIKPDFSNLGAWAKKKTDWGPLTVSATYATHQANFSYDEALKKWQSLQPGATK